MEHKPAGRNAILLVEDEPLVAMAARHALEDLGFHVTVAHHGTAALDHAHGALSDELSPNRLNGPASPGMANGSHSASFQQDAGHDRSPVSTSGNRITAEERITPFLTTMDTSAQMRIGGIILAIVDVGLPDMSGITVAHGLRALAPLLPIIIASGHAWEELEEELSGLEAIFRLGKPYTGETLRQALHSMGVETQEPGV